MAVRTASADTRVGSAYREAWSIYRAHPRALLVPGAVLFLCFGVPSAVLNEVNVTSGGVVEVIGPLLLVLFVQSLGFTSSYLYYGYCEKVADQVRRTGDVSVRRALSDTWHVLWRLIASSVVAEFLVAIGLLLILPGIYLAYRYAVVAPAASFEHLWPRRAMKRSHELVKRHFWFVVATAVAMFAAEQIASTVGDEVGAALFSDHTIGAVIGDTLGDLLVGPFAGLVTAIAYFRLSHRGEPAVSDQAPVSADAVAERGPA